MKQVRQFRMHPDLLFSVIKAQAGTHEKALLEAVMNAVDAGATECNITLDEKGYVISDNGKGFSSRQEIEDFFETFGTPHKEGDATYGKFRMGRGQLFAFSRTVWHSNEFMMDVCIKTRGLDYVLKEKQNPFKGCKITGTWHEKVKSSEILGLTKEFKLLVKYMQIPIIFNGENISENAEKQKWDAQTPEAYIKKMDSSGTLSVYNLGALVCHYPSSKFGIGGVVVAKQQLNVNFARNDVLVTQCKVWKKISLKLNELMGIETKKKSVLSDSERIAMVNNLLSGKSYISQMLNKGVLMDITSKKPTINALLKTKRLSFSSGDRYSRMVEEKIHTQELAFVLDHDMLDRFGVNKPEQFVAKINKLIKLNNEYEATLGYRKAREEGISSIYQEFKPTLIPIEKLHKNFNSSFEFKNEKTITKKDACVLRVLNELSPQISGLIDTFINTKEKITSWNDMKKQTVRKISVGISQVAEAWTDGYSYIAFAERNISYPYAQSLISTMIHEYCHNEATNETHSHGIEFYSMFHDIAVYQAQRIGGIVTSFNEKLLREYTKAGIKANGLQFQVDATEKIQEIDTIEDTMMA